VYADETEVLGVGVVSALGGVEVGWITVLPGPVIWEVGWFSSEQPSRCVATPDAWFGDNIHGRGPDSSPKRPWAFAYTTV